jgi:hypothetical protein
MKDVVERTLTMPKRPVRKSNEEIEVELADMKIVGASRCDYVSKWLEIRANS